MQNITIFWFRRDLRIDDNHGLFRALSEGRSVLPIFIFDRNILDALDDPSDRRVTFIHQQLQQLHQRLREAGGTLHTYYGKPLDIWRQLVARMPITAVYCNRDYEPYAKQRDEQVAELLAEQGATFHGFKDTCIFERDEILTTQDEPYKVFTPYKRKWLGALEPWRLAHFDAAAEMGHLWRPEPEVEGAGVIPLDAMGFKAADCNFPDVAYDAETLGRYDQLRDYPAKDATSQLGIHLRFGTISVRQLAREAREINQTWLSQIVWRDFYFQILDHFPHVVDSAFRQDYDAVPWRDDEGDFQRWKEGQTGFPIVDAGMRQLNATGYMHNRVRMIVASFLCKDLLLDWRWGERYFAAKLLDYDLAANNGNWQWAAGTGCDAAPYFRVFNPWTQTERFDPEGKYIATWVPEWQSDEYPSPMVDHSFARKRAVKVYKTALAGEPLEPEQQRQLFEATS